jgi:C_GCAxxG_C_C family probable redox protein
MDQEYQEVIEKAARLGYEYEEKFFGCSQSVVAGLIEAFGIGRPDILRVSTAFAGGVVRRGILCGALSGGLIVISFLTGRDDLEFFEQYQRGMKFAEKFYNKFEEKFGTINCKEIQKIKFGKIFNLQRPEERETLHQLMKSNPDGCQAVTGEGARLAAEVIVEILKQGPPLARILAQYP